MLILCATSIAFLWPAISHRFKRRNKRAALCAATSLASLNYWRNPYKNYTTRLLVDKVIARGSFVYHVVSLPHSTMNNTLCVVACTLYRISEKMHSAHKTSFKYAHAAFHGVCLVGMLQV